MPSKLEFNLIWIERTFRSRITTEQLLSPERDAGVVQPADYDAALAFLPGPHRHYNNIGTVFGAGMGYAARRPSWTPGRLGSIVLFAALTGRAAGSAYAVFSFYRFLKNLKDPEGFAKALQNIHHRIENPSSIQQTIDAPPVEMSSPSSQTTASGPAPGTPAPVSAWDRIRAANSKQVQHSSWDALRQSHERSRIPQKGQDPSPQADTNSRFYDDNDRAAEQARFDALLEKERNFK